MNLNKDNMKKILGVITFTLLLTAILMNMGAVKSYFGFLWGILFPFVMGGAIAFILNLPMTAIERKLFPRGGKACQHGTLDFIRSCYPGGCGRGSNPAAGEDF